VLSERSLAGRSPRLLPGWRGLRHPFRSKASLATLAHNSFSCELLASQQYHLITGLNLSVVPWHRRNGVIQTSKPESSQALAIDVFAIWATIANRNGLHGRAVH
jgi:hypothetical protein